MRGPISKVCECCKQGFTCGQYGCWCAKVEVNEQQMAWIEKSFHDCLCPLCLQRVVNGELGPAPVAEPEEGVIVRITKVYTRTGDGGSTRLAGGQQVSKDCLRVEAYGTVDELSASIGLARAMNEEATPAIAAAKRLEQDLRWVQNKLFDVGSLLATAPGQTFKNMPTIKARDTVKLERMMDRCQKDLPPLKEFILPGGGKVSATLHQARTICRRAERTCVGLAKAEPLDAEIIKFLNRLSDALFVLARWVAKTQGEPEFLWERNTVEGD